MKTDKEKLIKYWKDAGIVQIFDATGVTTGRIVDMFNGFIVMEQSTGGKVWICMEGIFQIRETYTMRKIG